MKLRLLRLGSLPVRLGVVGIKRSPASVTITLAPADRIMERPKLLPPIEPEHS